MEDKTKLVMQEELTIKHLAPYLDTDLSIYVYGMTRFEDYITKMERLNNDNQIYFSHEWNDISNNQDYFKPILRPLSSLTESELKLFTVNFRMYYQRKDFDYGMMLVSDFEIANELHLDYRGLIGRGLAIEK